MSPHRLVVAPGIQGRRVRNKHHRIYGSEHLACISHHSTTASAESSALTALCFFGLLDVLHEYACGGLSRDALSGRPFRRLTRMSSSRGMMKMQVKDTRKRSGSVQENLCHILEKRESENGLRELKQPSGLIDFCSSDYLGFATNRQFQSEILDRFSGDSSISSGSTGSRLLTGNTELHERVEQSVAQFHGAEAGLIFNSGYDANIGVLSTLPQRGDTVIYDSLCHASIRDGIRLGFAKSCRFRHNDLGDLEKKLSRGRGQLFVAVESVYSMDGDLAPLHEIVPLSERYGAQVVVDEAHATGVFGAQGKGRVEELGLGPQMLARVHTFGKALGCHGAIVLGSRTVRSYLINFCRSFIYTTALPAHCVAAVDVAYQRLQTSVDELSSLQSRIGFFARNIPERLKERFIPSRSPIQSLVVPGNAEVTSLAAYVQNGGFDVLPIRSPTIPKGKERLRICLHSFNTNPEIVRLSEILGTHAKSDR